MGAFEYTALDAGGRSRKGVIEGDTPRHVRSLLRDRQLMPVTVEAVAARESRRQRGSRECNSQSQGFRHSAFSIAAPPHD